MAITEQIGLMQFKDENGNEYILYPVVKAEGVDGIEDFPVSAGRSGQWQYAKWNSGRAECWGQIKLDDFQSKTVWGSIFYGEVSAILFPFTFTEVPKVTANFATSGGRIIGSGIEALGTDKITRLYAISPVKYDAADPISGYVAVYAVGRWK